MMDMANDSASFQSRLQLANEGWELRGNVFYRDDSAGRLRKYLPLYEAKMVHHFDHRWATYENGKIRTLTISEKEDPNCVPMPRYWVYERDVYCKASELPKKLQTAFRKKDKNGIFHGLALHLFANHLLQSNPDPRTDTKGKGLASSWYEFCDKHPFGSEVKRPSLRDKSLQKSIDLLRCGWSQQLVPNPLRTTDDVLQYGEELIQRTTPQWFIGWRDITNSTNERTLINGIIPRVGVGHKFLLIRLQRRDIGNGLTLAAILSSLACDYVSRQKLGGTSFTYFTMNQIAVLPPSSFRGNELEFIWTRVLELTYTAWDLKEFARDIGWHGPPFKWNQERRDVLRAELDAFFFHKYLASANDGSWLPLAGHSSRQGGTNEIRRLKAHFSTPRQAVEYVLGTFPIVRRREESTYGYFRTRELIIAIYDQMQECKSAGKEYHSQLSPPPADPRCCHGGSSR